MTLKFGQSVLDCGVVVDELGWRVLFSHARVLRGEIVALKAEIAGPVLGTKVDLAERVEDGAAGVA